MNQLNLLKNTSKNNIIPELLVPAGDIDCIRAGVENGADCIYFGSKFFSARAGEKNFSLEDLKEIINYCKLRNVKTNLTLNTLIKDSEFQDSIKVAKAAYESGVDAIIVQDLGLAKYLIKNFPGIEIHASTQMSVHNLEGVLELEKLGFSRVVLSREVPINEIEYIRNNCNVDLEMFIHGALCISYSGQCLFSSLVGGRSGNRGKCAQPCRLPYELIQYDNLDNQKIIDKGHLLSPKDLCSLEYLPKLIKLGINSFKIEGRLKSPEYVATVTRIYRKYIDLAMSDNPFVIKEQDKKDLLQVFNRGGFSAGHLDSEPNKELIFPKKPNNMGIYIGHISNYNPKGYIKLQLNENLSIGDSISIEGETGKYTISELMKGNTNIKNANSREKVTIGRMKGNIKIGAKVYKITDKELFDTAKKTFSENSELKKIPLKCFLNVKKDEPIKIIIYANKEPFYKNISVEYTSTIIPDESIKTPITKDRLIAQLNKLGNTPYIFEDIEINLDDNLHIPSISEMNNLRRTAISMLQEKVISRFMENRKKNLLISTNTINKSNLNNLNNRKISILLENLNTEYNYSNLNSNLINNIYIPLKYFTNNKYELILNNLSKAFNLFIYMPTILKQNYRNILLNKLDQFIYTYSIKGFIISNISGFTILEKYLNNPKYTFISNYTMNVFNENTINELKVLGTNIITPSIELDKETLQNICTNSSLPIELIAYGRSILMNSSYCLLGKSNKCYPECKMMCKSNNKYYIKDRLGLNFRIIPDNIQTITTIYNSKITSIASLDINAYSLRINILDEDIDEINTIASIVKTGKKLEGKQYTNGNLNRLI